MEFTDEQKKLLRVTKCSEIVREEDFHLFLEQCRRYKLDPFLDQIYAVVRNSYGDKVLSTQIGVEGWRAISERSGEFEGLLGPLFADDQGNWTDLWTSDNPPFAAKVGVMRTGFREPLWSTSYYKQSVSVKRDGTPNSFWKSDPCGMLAKTAESGARKKAFSLDAVKHSDAVTKVGPVNIEALSEARANNELSPQKNEPLTQVQAKAQQPKDDTENDSVLLTAEEASKLHKTVARKAKDAGISMDNKSIAKAIIYRDITSFTELTRGEVKALVVGLNSILKNQAKIDENGEFQAVDSNAFDGFVPQDEEARPSFEDLGR